MKIPFVVSESIKCLFSDSDSFLTKRVSTCRPWMAYVSPFNYSPQTLLFLTRTPLTYLHGDWRTGGEGTAVSGNSGTIRRPNRSVTGPLNDSLPVGRIPTYSHVQTPSETFLPLNLTSSSERSLRTLRWPEYFRPQN